MTWRNLAVAPLVFLVRVPLLALGTALVWLGERLRAAGFALPALEKEE